MISAGIGMVSIIIVKNKTDNLISKIDFIYDSDSKKINLKKMKSNENKQTGISTMSQVTNLRMSLNDGENSYLIKETLPRGYTDKLIITIHTFNDNSCEFVVDVEPYS